MWKKSNESAADSAVMTPAVRPPSAARATTTIMNTNAALVVLKNERATAITAPTATVAGNPTARPMTRPVSSMIGWSRRSLGHVVERTTDAFQVQVPSRIINAAMTGHLGTDAATTVPVWWG